MAFAALSMQTKPLVLQGALFASLYLGGRALRKMVRTPVHASVKARTQLAGEPGLAECLTQVVNMLPEHEVEAFLDQACRLVHESKSSDPVAQGKMTRLSREIMSVAESAATRVDALASDEVFRQVLAYREDVLPRLRGSMDDLLYNHLLDRAPRR